MFCHSRHFLPFLYFIVFGKPCLQYYTKGNIEFKYNEGDKIRFFYRPENSISNISVDNENHELDSCLVLENVGYFISAIKKEFDNGIIWNMDGHTFNLWGKLSMDELKKMAESILEK